MSQARGWSAFRDGLVNLSAVDPEWVLGRYELQLVEGQDLSECNDTALPVPTSGLRVRLRARE